ncbi:hypothetical protein LguiA_025932 [Lonicera macranthoides]
MLPVLLPLQLRLPNKSNRTYLMLPVLLPLQQICSLNFSYDQQHIPNASCFAASPVEIADTSAYSISPMISQGKPPIINPCEIRETNDDANVIVRQQSPSNLNITISSPVHPHPTSIQSSSCNDSSHSVYTASSPKTQNKRENASSNPLFLHTNTSSTNTVVSCTLTLQDIANENWDGRPLPQFRIQDKPSFSCKSPAMVDESPFQSLEAMADTNFVDAIAKNHTQEGCIQLEQDNRSSILAQDFHPPGQSAHTTSLSVEKRPDIPARSTAPSNERISQNPISSSSF